MAESRNVVLLAHGSRDPLWREPIERIAQAMRRRDAQAQVACAYLELTPPDLSSAVRRLVLDGAREIDVVPMLLGVGRHAREDLPRVVADAQAACPDVLLRLRPAVGEDQRLVELIAAIALGE
ncbi:MAG: Sirohydrochlorin cobaltochelatase CbiX(small) [Burkholderiaceae bacterium]|jgi:sirohydrochlorin cobaltochelatase|nr:MAG: Sirohydrochlorin cobaltochelatase CbiX(small) [Burkholderiaceae bacterium]